VKTKNNTLNQRITLDMNTQKKHQKDLGLEVPKDYFASSRKVILEQTVHQKRGKVISFQKKISIWSAVAVVAILFTLAIYNPIENSNTLEVDDVLIASLFTEEDNVDVFLDNFVNDELLTEDVFKND